MSKIHCKTKQPPRKKKVIRQADQKHVKIPGKSNLRASFLQAWPLDIPLRDIMAEVSEMNKLSLYC